MFIGFELLDGLGLLLGGGVGERLEELCSLLVGGLQTGNALLESDDEESLRVDIDAHSLDHILEYDDLLVLVGYLLFVLSQHRTIYLFQLQIGRMDLFLLVLQLSL